MPESNCEPAVCSTKAAKAAALLTSALVIGNSWPSTMTVGVPVTVFTVESGNGPVPARMIAEES